MAGKLGLGGLCAALVILLSAPSLWAQSPPPPPPPPSHQGHGHPPPPQAYADCRGKKAGDTVQHTTPQGKVPATCEDSPEGLVARPHNPPPQASSPPPPPPGVQPAPRS
ncbi:hypothetical protein [Azospirillum sp. sgz302134]